ncbi:MAG: Asp-tRNA(Asn)/Glu-tRNA(Gln) amidotransferase subunit GatA [Phycisphaerales bacterium]
MSLTSIRDAVAGRRMSVEALARGALERIAALNPELNAFTQVFEGESVAAARRADARLAAGEPARALEGVPIALKDNLCLNWGRTTCASRFLSEYRSPFSATAAQRLIDAGAIIVGKTNLDEFAMGSSTEHSAFGPTRNPWDTTRVPGGTSGGSAAAVAAGLCAAALGSDTGGSIRQPAGFCGVVGIKPTYGRVSRWGLVAHASSLDQIGPLARSVRDAGVLLSVIAGHDARDSTSAPIPAGADFVHELERVPARFRVGVPRQCLSSANTPEVSAALEHARATFAAIGGEVVEVDLPHADHAIAAYYLISTAEASSNLARFDGVRFGRRAALRPGEGLDELYRRSRAEGFGPEVQRRIMLGTHVLSAGYYDAYYVRALRVRRLIRQDFDRAFGSTGSRGPAASAGAPACDALLMPTSPSPAFRIGEKSSDPLAMYLEDIYTVSVNLAGLPAVAFPGLAATAPTAGSRRTLLPVGLQLVGPALSESRLLQLAAAFERAAPAAACPLGV